MKKYNSSGHTRPWEIDGLKYLKLLKEGNKDPPSFLYLICRTDNAIKNHFYSSLRKNISRISKDVVSLD